MEFLKAFLLAAVEGVTEFLPVSSTAHLVLLDRMLVLSEDASFDELFRIAIQFSAILAAAVYFRKDILPIPNAGAERRAAVELWMKVLLGVIPVGVAGLLLSMFVPGEIEGAAVISAALFTGGVIIVVVERRERSSRVVSLEDISIRMALAIGLIQCLALVPGVSRSGATIIGAMLLGADRVTAVRFSFILAIPTLAAAAAYSLFSVRFSFASEGWMVLGFGCLVSFGVGLAVVSGLMRYIQSHSLAAFGYYRIVLALVLLFAIFVGWIDGFRVRS